MSYTDGGMKYNLSPNIDMLTYRPTELDKVALRKIEKQGRIHGYWSRVRVGKGNDEKG